MGIIIPCDMLWEALYVNTDKLLIYKLIRIGTIKQIDDKYQIRINIQQCPRGPEALLSYMSVKRTETITFS